MDPISIGLALASLASSTAGGISAKNAAQESAAQNLRTQELGLNYQLGNQQQALLSALLGQQQGLTAQQQGLADTLAAARGTQADRLSAAGGLRFDQAGNATYYDRDQGRWVTVYTPQQERARTAEQAQQERTLARGAQASEDYAQQRAGYLYKRPETEAVIQDEIRRLLQQAQGQGERGLNTLMQRFGTRTAGNIPTVQQLDTGPSPGQQLAETMLKARSAALGESQSREKAHADQYLPAMAAFEKTANVAPQEGNVGRTITGMAAQGGADRLAALTDYAKMLPGIYAGGTKDLLGVLESSGKNIASTYDTGSRGVASALSGLGSAGNAATAAAGVNALPKTSEYASLINALKPKTVAGTKPTGTLGSTTGATYLGDDGILSTNKSSTGTNWYQAGLKPSGVGGDYARDEYIPEYQYPTIWNGDWSF